jgi:putative transposase
VTPAERRARGYRRSGTRSARACATTAATSPTVTGNNQLLRRRVESKQYTSGDYIQQLDDANVLASIGSVGDAYDNAMAESFVDSYKTELIADRVWKSRSQLELATVEWVAWFNNERLHEALGDIPPVEFEQLHAARTALISDNGSVAALSPSAANGLTTRRVEPVGLEIAVDDPCEPEDATSARAVLAKTAPQVVAQRTLAAGLSDE